MGKVFGGQGILQEEVRFRLRKGRREESMTRTESMIFLVFEHKKLITIQLLELSFPTAWNALSTDLCMDGFSLPRSQLRCHPHREAFQNHST